MKYTDIYQTLEDRQNYNEVEANGPYFCYAKYPNGEPKKGTREPWLGEGFYFWDTRIDDAKWWGDTVYEGRSYIICHTTYDQHSPLLYDLVGNVSQFDEFVKCAQLVKNMLGKQYVTFPVVLEYLQKDPQFTYKAVRAWPSSGKTKKTCIIFPDNQLSLVQFDKIQICFFDKSLLTEPYCIVHRQMYEENQTI